MDLFVGIEPIKIDLVYADANHPRNIFGEMIYHPTARLWAHKDIAAITIGAARILNKNNGWILELKDCLRTSDSQAAMEQTQIVKDHPQWLVEPNQMLAPVGGGAHPRAMAMDVCVYDIHGDEINMGTPFDDMSEKSHRQYEFLNDKIKQNRCALENAFMDSARKLNMDFLPYLPEWWDFRFPADIYKQYAPLSDADLPPQMQMTEKTNNNIPDFSKEHFDKLTQDILYRVNEAF